MTTVDLDIPANFACRRALRGTRGRAAARPLGFTVADAESFSRDRTKTDDPSVAKLIY